MQAEVLVPQQIAQAPERPLPPLPSGLIDPMQLYCVPGTGSAWCGFTGSCINTATEKCPAPPYIQNNQLSPCVRSILAYCDMHFAGQAADSCKYGVLTAAQDAYGVASTAAVAGAMLFPQPFAVGAAWAKETCVPAATV